MNFFDYDLFDVIQKENIYINSDIDNNDNNIDIGNGNDNKCNKLCNDKKIKKSFSDFDLKKKQEIELEKKVIELLRGKSKN